MVRPLRLDSMRKKFLAIALLTAVVPTLVMTAWFYGRERRSLEDRVGRELRSASSDAAREVGVWLSERLYDLRLRASPYILSDNLARVSGRGAAQAVVRLRDYLHAIRPRLPAHDGLVILDADGQLLTSSGSRTAVRMSPERLNGLRTGDAWVGEAFWDAGLAKPVMVLVVPIRQDDGLFVGALGAKINLDDLHALLERLAGGSSRRVYLITEQGRVVLSSDAMSAQTMRTTLSQAATDELLDRDGGTVAQARPEGEAVVAAPRRIPQVRWAAIAEAPRTAVAAEAGRLRARTLALLGGVVAGVALLVFIVAVMITRPLERLTEAAARAAAGELAVELPPGGGGETGYLTRAFNTLLSRLRERESQGELERLSLTDALTGLYNRRHLMGTLASEVQRARRSRRGFSVLLADVDRFKQYNDTYGHLAGDAALVRIADIVRKLTRAVDCVARYGGEEFVVMLLETNLGTAAQVAERIRARVAAEDLGAGRLTVSIGLAEYPEGGETPEELIASADAAMYQAKSAGRDRVVAGKAAPRDQKKERGRRREA